MTGTKNNSQCVPYVSEYTDCNAENQCMGCTRCTCSPEGTWVCKKVRDCPKEYESVDENSVDDAFNTLLHEFQSKNADKTSSDEISTPKPQEEQVLVPEKKEEIDLEGEILSLLREKRSLDKKKNGKEDTNDKDIEVKNTNDNNTGIIFYHTVDELNEDILKDINVTGTLEAKKVEINIPSRRSDLKDNGTFDNSLQIEYSKPQNYHQSYDNKIEGNHSEYGIDLEQEKIGIITNQSQHEKDKDLSKIVVNELKIGSEYIGDKNAPVTSNITFTPENDTLTAMAFIAGNLLNKLWDMEKEASEESLELEAIKNEKLQDLLELFKEPLTTRQEAFLKNALESLSKAIDKNKNAQNISICESLNEAKEFVDNADNMDWDRSKIIEPEKVRKNNELPKMPLSTPQPVKQNNNATAKAVSKISNVLSMMKKYESVQKHLNELRNKKRKNIEDFVNKMSSKPSDYSVEHITENGTDSLNLFGKILEKITKLLLPYKKSKKMVHKIRNKNVFSNDEDAIKKKIKSLFNTDVGNVSLTMKDKIILDYLTKIKKNPRSFLDDEGSAEIHPSYVEKDILLNLSEFFKMKSFVDLIKMLDGDKTSLNNRFNLRSGDDSSSTLPTTTTEIVTKKIEFVSQSVSQKYNVTKLETSTTESPKTFANTKEKFKAHLKTILDDLVELHREAGTPGKDLELANALPCIYNILKGSNVFNTSNPNVDPYKKLSQVFLEVKQEYRIASGTLVSRRMDKTDIKKLLKDTPKSTLVWERVVKNVEKQQKQNARRNSDISAPIPTKDLMKKLEKMQEIGSISNSLIIKKSLDPTEQLILIKSFHAEAQRNLDSLKDIKASIDLITSLPKEQQEDITDFVYKAANKIKLHSKILDYIKQNNNLKKTPPPKFVTQVSNVLTNKTVKTELKSAKLVLDDKQKTVMETKENKSIKKNKQIQLTREDVMNQLIRNRVSMYMRTLQSKAEYRDDPNYNIAKSILLNLDSGNVGLAKQLYKIFVTSKKQNAQNTVNDKTSVDKIIYNDKQISEKLSHEKVGAPALPSMSSISMPVPVVPDFMTQVRRQSILEKEPLIHFEDPRYYNQNQFLSARRDQMLRNMLASKNLKFR